MDHSRPDAGLDQSHRDMCSIAVITVTLAQFFTGKIKTEDRNMVSILF